MRILGISAFYHDSAACLLIDGNLVAAVQEERFSRKRHDSEYPKLAIEHCLKTAGLTLDQIDLVAYYEKPFLKFERILETLIDDAPQSFPLAIQALPVWIKDKMWIRKKLGKALGRKIPIIFTGHHESHAASAFFPSPFKEAATLTIDGVGEWSTTTWGIGRENKLELKEEIRYPHSLGLLYSAFTQYLGFRVNSAEYKVMGLAPYGEPKYVDLIRDHLIQIFPDGSFILNMEYFAFNQRKQMINHKFEKLFNRPRRKEESKLERYHADVARSLQVVTEDAMLGLARHVHAQSGMKNLCLAGGVALNCVANGRVLREGPFENLWIQPGAGDSGGAVGAAYVAWHHVYQKPRAIPMSDKQKGSFLGPDFADEEIASTLSAYGLKTEKCDESALLEKTASLLDEQNIVGWFQGKMEFGPRSLGNRSIIGDARNPEMQSRMNLKIKFRESFRPFAPSILKEDAKEYFDIDVVSPYMLLTCQVVNGVSAVRAASQNSSDGRWMSEMLRSIPSKIPAVTHVDGSARVHTVERNTNPRFYDLLKAFKAKTNSSCVINTSFNVRGEPIVCTPEDAVRCFLKTDIDALVIGSFIVKRTDQSPETLKSLRERLHQEDQFELD